MTKLNLQVCFWIRYKSVKRKKIAIFGVVCGVEENGVILSCLTKYRLDVTMDASTVKMGDVILLINPAIQFNEGKIAFEMGEGTQTIRLGKSVDFGICSHVHITIHLLSSLMRS